MHILVPTARAELGPIGLPTAGGWRMLTPRTEAELAEIVRGANGPLAVRGGGTRHVPGDGEALTTSGLSGITLYEPGALTLVAGAGTSMAEVEAALAAEGQRLPFEPMDHRGLLGTTGEPTIGGAVAMNASGPRRVVAGACRDSLIGVRFVDGGGTVVKNGGRVMKNVTGYDLARLLAGSRGTLGVLTEVAFKVLPASETEATLVWHGLGETATKAVFASALSSPFNVTGAARLPGGEKGKHSWTFVRIEGLRGSVAYRGDALAKRISRIAGPDAVVTDKAESAAIWRRIRDVELFVAKPGRVWRTHIRPSHMDRVTGYPLNAYPSIVDWGGGLIWTLTPDDVDLEAELGDIEGHVSLARGTGWARRERRSAIAALEDGLRAKFDPRGLFAGAA